MKWQVVVGLLTASALVGCVGTGVPKDIDPSNNETTLNMLESAAFVGVLKCSGSIPGVSTNDHGRLETVSMCDPTSKAVYPFEMTLRAQLDSEPSAYYWYLVRKERSDGSWRMVRAWKTDKKGTAPESTMELPTENAQETANRELKNDETLKEMRKTPNKASDATSEPAPGAASSSHEG